jgi:hypothetical protein
MLRSISSGDTFYDIKLPEFVKYGGFSLDPADKMRYNETNHTLFYER